MTSMIALMFDHKHIDIIKKYGVRGTCRPCMNSVSLLDRLVRLKQAPQTSECIIDTRTNLVYQSSVCQLCISRLLNCHPVNKLALTYHAYPVYTDTSTATYGHI